MAPPSPEKATDNSLKSIFRRSLSSRLLALTIVFVFIAEILVLIPSVAKQRMSWLTQRAEAAYLVGLALESDHAEMIGPEAAEQLFATANILGVTVNRDGARMMIMAPAFDETNRMHFVDLRNSMPTNMITDAWSTIFSRDNHTIRVVATPKYAPGGFVDIFVSEDALRRDLLAYARNILLLSLLISTLTAALVYWTLNRTIVSPVRRLTRNMMAFENNPEDERSLLQPTNRLDEIGAAEQGLAAMERRIQLLLSERQRLAALGAGISKISHDLRNILASAQLMSDRLARSDDPRVRKLSPKLISALDRAIALSRDTLSYARMEPSALKKEPIVVADLIDEVFDDTASLEVDFRPEIEEGATINGDRTQLYRVLVNLVRNSVDALLAGAEENGAAGSERRFVRIAAAQNGDRFVIDIDDNGPGIPETARAHLFEPFKGSFKPGGSGLGIAIAHEIVRAHNGDLELVSSDANGTHFKVTLPG